MAYDRIEPPHMWESAIVKLLYRLVCSWSDKPPKMSEFFPSQPVEPMTEDQILRAFGIKPR